MSRQDSTERPKTKFIRWYNLRQKAAHPSVNTKKDEGVLAEFISPEREGRYIKIKTELVNFQIFYHSNRMAGDQFPQLLQALIEKAIANMQPSSGRKRYIILAEQL